MEIDYSVTSFYSPDFTRSFTDIYCDRIFFAWKNAFLQAEKLKVEMLAYKYESLRNQINPHFLFNSLNVLSDLVYDDQAMAVKFIRQLSDLFVTFLIAATRNWFPLRMSWNLSARLPFC